MERTKGKFTGSPPSAGRTKPQVYGGFPSVDSPGHDYRSYRVRKETFSGMKAFQRYGLFDLRLSRYAALRMAGERTTH